MELRESQLGNLARDVYCRGGKGGGGRRNLDCQKSYWLRKSQRRKLREVVRLQEINQITESQRQCGIEV